MRFFRPLRNHWRKGAVFGHFFSAYKCFKARGLDLSQLPDERGICFFRRDSWRPSGVNFLQKQASHPCPVVYSSMYRMYSYWSYVRAYRMFSGRLLLWNPLFRAVLRYIHGVFIRTLRRIVISCPVGGGGYRIRVGYFTFAAEPEMKALLRAVFILNALFIVQVFPGVSAL